MGSGELEEVNFLNKESKAYLKKKNSGGGGSVGLGGGGRGFGAEWWCGGIDGWTDEQAQTNLPLQLLRIWGHNNALMYKLCPGQSSIYDHFII